MTNCTARVIEDSVAANTGIRLTTLQLRYPRFIHAEFMTHRVFSRNASSSRAIPVAKVIEQVRTDPAMPIHWGKNQPGMQANDALSGDELYLVQEAWRNAARAAANFASDMASNNAHKQVANRILEPFQFMHVIVTATEWLNFFELRDHEDAEPNIRALAVAMREAMNGSTPNVLHQGDWHTPYVSIEKDMLPITNYMLANGLTGDENAFLDIALKCSAARCARVSYLTHDGQQPDVAKDVELYNRLVGSRPLHASPIEHQATPSLSADEWYGNFRGWVQNRKLIEQSL